MIEKLDPGVVETVDGEYGAYKRYFLYGDELQKYRDLPHDTFWDHHSKPHVTPSGKTKGA